MLISEIFKETKFKRLGLTLLLVIPLEILSFFSIHLPAFIEYPLFTGIIYFFGRDVITGGLKSLTRLNFSDINLLMTIATIGAVYLGELEEAVIIIILFAVSEALEEFGITRSQNALEELVEKTPKTALLKGNEEKTPIEKIAIGDILVVKPGDYIPLDGVVLKGESLIDESTITGEPLPKNKFLGDDVFAGTLNTHGYLEIKVTKTSKDTTLAKIIDLTYQSAGRKSQTAKFVETFARIYTPVVIGLAFLLTAVPVLVFNQPLEKWFMQSLTLLLIACPCALVISTPITVFAAIGNATKRGILIKGGQFLEEMGQLKVIAFDKTRTLTKGEPVVSDIIPFNGFSKEELLACAAGMEAFSEHPLAKSIVERAKEEKLSPHEFASFKAIMGKGLAGECMICLDKHHCMGNLKFITQEHEVEERIIQQVEKFEKEGKTTIIMTEDKKVVGVIAITDTIREESMSLIESLLRMKIKPVMLTGDNASSASFVASQVGIHEVRANLLPDDKVKEVSELLKQYKHVAMVGDGVNDAPALATSSVGIVMGAIGSDVAVENADIALMNNNLQLIPFLIKLGSVSVQTMRINIGAAVGVKLLFLTLAVGGKSNLALALLADVGVTIAVVTNSLRLFNFRSDSD